MQINSSFTKGVAEAVAVEQLVRTAVIAEEESDDIEVTLEQAQLLMDMLTGEPIEERTGIRLAHQPQLTPQAAFSVIYYLQEHLRLIPDSYEQCIQCGKLHDTSCGGYTVDATDEVDLYTLDIFETLGLDPGVLKDHDGANFCDQTCEYEYWRAVANGDSND